MSSDRYRVLHGDALEQLRTLPDCSVHCCVTSPPYFGLRDYKVAGQIGLEATPAEFVARLVAVFREVRRVLRDDGTCWVNLGDSYNNAGSSRNGEGLDGNRRGGATGADGECGYKKRDTRRAWLDVGIKHKDRLMIPARFAIAAQEDGWFLRDEIVWHKPNPMPESVTDRCTKSHEMIYLLTKSARYHFDADAIKEPAAPETKHRYASGYKVWGKGQFLGSPTDKRGPKEIPAEKLAGRGDFRNRRSVWTVTTKPYKGAHFATFPPDLIRPCILAGCPVGGTVFDPFAGSGTTLAVAVAEGRQAIGIELNPDYITLIHQRVSEGVKPTKTMRSKVKSSPKTRSLFDI